VVEPWFLDSDTRRFLGGPEWPALMLARDGRILGKEFRGAVQTGAYRYLAHADGHPCGYVDCGTFDRCTVCGGEDPAGPIVIETIDVATGSIAFAVDPEQRRRGLGRAMIVVLLSRPELRQVELFEAGVEPENIASRRCVEAAGFGLRSDRPDFEGMLYFRAWRTRVRRRRPARRRQLPRHPTGQRRQPAARARRDLSEAPGLNSHIVIQRDRHVQRITRARSIAARAWASTTPPRASWPPG